MKIQDMHVGQFVEMIRDSQESQKIIPEVGWVVGLELQYDTRIIATCRSDSPLEILPSIQFVGEKHPRGVNPYNLKPLRG